MVLSMAVALEHDPEKWKPVFRKDHVLASSMRCPDVQSAPFGRALIYHRTLWLGTMKAVARAASGLWVKYR
jgi:hypothetical protein